MPRTTNSDKGQAGSPIVTLACLGLAVFHAVHGLQSGQSAPERMYREFAYVSNGGSETVSVIDRSRSGPPK